MSELIRKKAPSLQELKHPTQMYPDMILHTDGTISDAALYEPDTFYDEVDTEQHIRDAIVEGATREEAEAEYRTGEDLPATPEEEARMNAECDQLIAKARTMSWWKGAK